MSERHFNAMDEALQDVLSKFGSLTPEKKSMSEPMKKVFSLMISHMKNDEAFNYLYKNVMLAGCSYERLKNIRTDEQDINILFSWPPDLCEVIHNKKQPGYVKLKINWNKPSFKTFLNNSPNLEKKLLKWTDKTEFLSSTNFKFWMEGVITKALNSMPHDDIQIKQRKSDHGFTITVTQKFEEIEHSIDLVPVFVFTKNKWSQFPVHELCPGSHSEDWLAVPKEPKCEDQSLYWRVSFYHQEEEIINYVKEMKNVQNLIEHLIYHQNWSDLDNYAIKTMFLYESKTSRSIKLWQTGLGKSFIHMLQKLSSYLENRSLPYYWESQLNLLANMKESTANNIMNRISAILKHVDGTPHAIKRYFGYTEEEIGSMVSHTSNTTNDSFNSTLGLIGEETDGMESIFQQPKENKTSEQVSNLTSKLLSEILKEQREIKQYLQIISEQHIGITKEINEIRQENSQMRELFQSKSNGSHSQTRELFLSKSNERQTPSVQKCTQSLIDLDDTALSPTSTHQICSHCGSSLSTNQKTTSSSQLSAVNIRSPTASNDVLLNSLSNSLNNMSFSHAEQTISKQYDNDVFKIF